MKIDTGGNQGRDYDHTPMEGPLYFSLTVLVWVILLLGVALIVHIVAW